MQRIVTSFSPLLPRANRSALGGSRFPHLDRRRFTKFFGKELPERDVRGAVEVLWRKALDVRGLDVVLPHERQGVGLGRARRKRTDIPGDEQLGLDLGVAFAVFV